MTVKLVVFDDKAFRLSKNLFFQVESFISDAGVIEAHREEYGIDEDDFARARARYRREYEIDELDGCYAESETCLSLPEELKVYRKDVPVTVNS